MLDASARVFIWEDFLSEAECDYLKAKAEARLERSGVVDAKSGTRVAAACLSV